MKFQYLLVTPFFCFLSLWMQAGDESTASLKSTLSDQRLKAMMAQQSEQDSNNCDSDNEFYNDLNEKIMKLSSDDADGISKENRSAIPQAILDQLQNKKFKNKGTHNASCFGIDIPDEDSDLIPQEEFDLLCQKNV